MPPTEKRDEKMHEPLCCERVEVLMGEYLDGALPRPLLLRVESHLVVCLDCWREVQKFRHTIACLATLSRRPMPALLKSRIITAARPPAPSHR